MRNTILLLFGLVLAPRAFGHAGCSGEPFASRFCELAESSFKVRPLPAGEPHSYVVMKKTGERLVLDSRYQRAMRFELGAMIERNESETLYAEVGWGEWAKWHARRRLEEFKHLASRRFVLEVAGGAVEGGFRFGRIFPPMYLAGEALEHGIAWALTGYFFNSQAAVAVAAMPWCGVVMGGCLLFAKETQEFANVFTRGRTTRGSLVEKARARWEDWTTWRASKKLRREVRRALRTVRRTHDDADLSELAYRRSFRDFGAGTEVVWGGPFHPGFFRSALAAPICEDCDVNRLKTFRYKGFGGPGAAARPVIPNQIPMVEDFGLESSVAQRMLRADEYVSFVDTVFAHATLAAGDLIRNREKDAAGESKRVSLAVTWRKVRGYLSLRRDLGRMRRALDLYSFAIFTRAFRGQSRSAQDELLDRDFAGTLGNFIAEFNAKLKRVDAFGHRGRDEASFLNVAPGRAFDTLADWIRTGQFCADGLEAEPR